MSTDESGAPWPYEEFDPAEAGETTPTWECPDNKCACHPVDRSKEELVDHTIVFFDHVAKRMPGARCRVLEDGHLLNKDSPWADGSGAVQVKLRPGTRYLRLEWAPKDLPRTPRYPFRKVYHVDLGETCDDGVARRLHNLGYSSYLQLADNIRDFQRTYLQEPTGESAHVEPQLVSFHDDSTLPPMPPASAQKGFSKTQEKSSLVGDGEQNAKKGDANKPDPSPGKAPGKAKAGSASGAQVTKVTIELHIAFALAEQDFATEDVEWPDMPYEPIKVLDEIYPRGDKRDFRIGGYGAHRIAGATLTRQEMDSSESIETEKDGHATFNLGDLEGKPRGFTFRVTPPKGQLNTTDRPAGPALTNEKDDVKHLFRPFTLQFRVDENGIVVPESVKTILPPGNPRHAKIIAPKPPRTEAEKKKEEEENKKGQKRASKETTFPPNTIVVDWRPDWWASGKEASRRPRLTDRVNCPKNPFDLAIKEEERLAACPAAVILHQTGTTNLNFLPGFIGDRNPKKTSIHYVVDYDGFVLKVLDEHYRANHGGFSLWDQRINVNSFTVGIETMHSDTDPPSPENEKFSIKPRRYMKEQYDAFLRLLGELKTEYKVSPRCVRGHMEVLATKEPMLGEDKKQKKDASGEPMFHPPHGILHIDRVGCPGPFFDWERLEQPAARVSLGPKAVPGSPPDPKPDHFDDLAKLKGVTSIKANQKSPEAKIVKQLLFDIGYSVRKDLPTFVNREKDLKKMRDALSDEYDSAMQAAVRAFQTHHFSGRRLGYNILNSSMEKKLPPRSTLDQKTIQAIMETWYAAMTEPKP